jgi:hypothetical protein
MRGPFCGEKGQGAGVIGRPRAARPPGRENPFMAKKEKARGAAVACPSGRIDCNLTGRRPSGGGSHRAQMHRRRTDGGGDRFLDVPQGPAARARGSRGRCSVGRLPERAPAHHPRTFYAGPGSGMYSGGHKVG